MRTSKALFQALLLLALSAAVVPLAAEEPPDYYTAGFFTRSERAGFYLDTGDPAYDLFYVPVRRVSLLPRATLTASREDNLFLSGLEAERGTVVRFVPGVTVLWGRPERSHLFADAGVSIHVYDSTDGRLERTPSLLLGAGGVWVTQKSQVTARGGFRRLEDLDTLVGARIVKRDYTANLGLDHRISGKTSMGVLGSFERHDYEAAGYVDYDRLYGAARLYTDISRRSQVFLQGGLGRDDLDTGSGGFGDAVFADASVGIRGKPSPKTSATGRAGYQWRTYPNDDIADVRRWIASLYASVNPFGFTTFGSELLADVRPAIQSAGHVAIDQRWTGSVTRRLFTERLRGHASIFLGRIDYRGPGRASNLRDPDYTPAFDGRVDDYWGYTLGIDWWARYNLSCGLSYSYVDNDAARGGDPLTRRASAYDSGRWMLRLSWNY